MRTLPDKPGRLDFASRLEQRLLKALVGVLPVPSARPYHLTMSHERRFIWFRVAKVGTRTIFKRFEKTATPLDVENASSVYYRPRAYRDYFKFGFVRNPWDRLVSCWMNKVVDSNYFEFPREKHERMQDYECFVDWVAALDIDNCDRHLCSQSVLIDLNHCDFIGRLESFEDDLQYVFNRIDVHPEKAFNANRNPRRKPYQVYYNDQICEKVERIYRRDIRIFGYSYEG